MVNRRFGAIFAFVVALATQTYSECIDPQVVRELASAMYQIQRVSSQPPMELPASDNPDHSNVRMRAMPVDADVDESRMQSPSDDTTRDHLNLMVAMKDARDRMRRSRMRNARVRSMPIDNAMDVLPVMMDGKMRDARMRSMDSSMETESVDTAPPTLPIETDNMVIELEPLERPNQMHRSMMQELNDLSDPNGEMRSVPFFDRLMRGEEIRDKYQRAVESKELEPLFGSRVSMRSMPVDEENSMPENRRYRASNPKSRRVSLVFRNQPLSGSGVRMQSIDDRMDPTEMRADMKKMRRIFYGKMRSNPLEYMIESRISPIDRRDPKSTAIVDMGRSADYERFDDRVPVVAM